MIDLPPASVPDLSEEWLASRRTALVDSLSQRQHRAMGWAALAGTTGVAATVSALLLVGGSEQYAFAGWSASPTTPTSGQVSSAESVCQSRLAQMPTSTNKGPNTASLVPELSDVRGPYTVTVFGNGTPDGVLCVSAPSATALRWIQGSNTPVDPGTIAVDQVSILAREGQPYTMVVGRTGTGVTGVTLSLGDGSTVTATSGAGLFIAWWPGSQAISSATVSTATGTSTQTLNLPGPGVPPATKPSPADPGNEPASVDAHTVCLIHSCS